jgi:hypothetical protein
MAALFLDELRGQYQQLARAHGEARAELEGMRAERDGMLGALGEKDAGVAGPAWDAALRLTNAAPEDAWAAVDARSTILPRLASALRHPHACPAAARGLLPLLSLAPPARLLPDGAKSLAALLDAAAAGADAAAGAPAAVSAACDAFREGLRWGVGAADALGGEAECARALFAGAFATSVLPAALAPGGGATLALAVACGEDARREGAPAWAWQAYAAAAAVQSARKRDANARQKAGTASPNHACCLSTSASA